jgi:hypothetical protein
MNEWGTPDWEYAGSYAHAAFWDENDWRWQFLRRRADYRADFEAALKAHDSQLDVPDDLFAETEFSLRADGMRAKPFRHKGALRYGLSDFYDPIVCNWGAFGPEWGTGLIYGGEHGREWRVTETGHFVTVDAEYMVALAFDLRRPLKAQLAEAEVELQSQQINNLELAALEAGTWTQKPIKPLKATKRHKANWVIYLRVLDAHEAGATLSEIAAILPSTYGRRDPQTAANVLKQAEEVQLSF